MNIVGVSHPIYWLSWFIVATLLNFTQTIVLIVSGKLFGAQLFQNCNASILFNFLFMFGQSIVFLAFLLSTLVSTLDKAIQLSFFVALFNVLVTISFMSAPITLNLFYTISMREHAFIRVVTFVLECFPIFNYRMCLGIICLHASRRFDFNLLNWVDGEPYGYEEYNKWYDIEAKMNNSVIRCPPASHFANNNIAITILFTVLWFYFDHVISSNRGVGYSYLFPFYKSYWASLFPRL